ncbi:MAG: hypothetical protein L0Y60_08890 [Beijerinckiaceae bacterium]|nr:hypothetical protein [Beijerinckiaceae bacterium]
MPKRAGVSPISRFTPANVFAHARARLTQAQPLGWRGPQEAGTPWGSACLRPAAVLTGLAAYEHERLCS